MVRATTRATLLPTLALLASLCAAGAEPGSVLFVTSINYLGGAQVPFLVDPHYQADLEQAGWQVGCCTLSRLYTYPKLFQIGGWYLMFSIVVGGACLGAVGFFVGDLFQRSTTGACIGATIGGVVPYAMILCVPIVALYLMWLYGSYRQLQQGSTVARLGIPPGQLSSTYKGDGKLIPLNK